MCKADPRSCGTPRVETEIRVRERDNRVKTGERRGNEERKEIYIYDCSKREKEKKIKKKTKECREKGERERERDNRVNTRERRGREQRKERERYVYIIVVNERKRKR